MTMTFGSLTLSVLAKTDASNTQGLDYLFNNYKKNFEMLNIFANEQKMAFEKLDKLTTELQTKRLRHISKTSCEYFTL